MWNVKRRVRGEKNGEKTFFTLPFGVVWTPGENGGVGMIPHTLIGANVDALMYQMYSPEMKEYVEYCSYVIDVEDTIFRDAIAKEAMEGEVFDSGQKWLESRLKHPIVLRSRDAESRLKLKNIKVGILLYEKSGERIVRRAIADNPRLVQVVKEEKKSAVNRMKSKQGSRKNETRSIMIFFPYPELKEDFMFLVRESPNYLYSTTLSMGETDGYMGRVKVLVNFDEETLPTGPLISMSPEYNAMHDKVLENPDYVINEIGSTSISVMEASLNLPRVEEVLSGQFYKTYRYQNFMQMRYGDMIEPKYDVCPVAGADPWMSLMLRTVGMSSTGDDVTIKISTLASMITRDKTVPSDITVDQIFRLVTNIAVSGDIEAIKDVMIAIGAQPETASQFALKAISLAGSFAFLNKTQSYSTQDMIIGHMDLVVENFAKFVDVFPFDDKKLVAFVQGLLGS